MPLGITTKTTIHGNPGQNIELEAGREVFLKPASNQLDDSDIKWWVEGVGGDISPELARWIECVGVGLHADDVRITS